MGVVNAYRCLLCGSETTAMLPAGRCSALFAQERVLFGGLREQARCPDCDGIDRHRSATSLIVRLMSERPISRVLEIGPSPAMRAFLQRRLGGRYIAIDLRPREGCVQMKVESLEFPTATFDLCICLHVLEHVEVPEAAVNEIARVVRRGGVGVFQTPLLLSRTRGVHPCNAPSDCERERLMGRADHRHLFTPAEFESLLSSSFRVQRTHVPVADVIRYKGYAHDWYYIGER